MSVQDAGTFLTRILDHKRTEVERQAAKIPLAQLAAQLATAPAPRPFDAALRQPSRVALIAEVKKASPSKGVLIENFDPLALARTYAEHGAAAISVLTDVRFFQGSLKYLEGIRAHLGEALPVPLLRKDFIIDPYQVYEARANGADCILIIMASVDDAAAKALNAAAHDLRMDVLVEIHNEEELKRALQLEARLIGINNRDLHTFKVDLATTERLAPKVPKDKIVVAESGIETHADCVRLERAGVATFLVGETLMRKKDVAAATRELLVGETAKAGAS